MSHTEIKAWAELMGVSQAWIRREVHRENMLERARKDPANWTVLKYPNGGGLHAFPRRFFTHGDGRIPRFAKQKEEPN